MTIRDIQDFVANLWDWGFLKECFGQTRIEPTDLDGVVERRGNVLVLETKKPGQSIPRGQEILFDALVEKHSFTILILWGQRNQPQRMQVWKRGDSFPVDEQAVKAYVQRWFSWADAHPYIGDIPF